MQNFIGNIIFPYQELRAVVQDAELGSRFVDRPFRVTELCGDESWIFIHVAVQGFTGDWLWRTKWSAVRIGRCVLAFATQPLER